MPFVPKETQTLTRLVRSFIVLFLLLAFCRPAVEAQKTPAQLVEEEAARREEALILLRQKLREAQEAQKLGRISDASKLYEDAYERAVFVGDLAEPEMRQIVPGLVQVRMQLAESAQKAGNLEE